MASAHAVDFDITLSIIYLIVVKVEKYANSGTLT